MLNLLIKLPLACSSYVCMCVLSVFTGGCELNVFKVQRHSNYLNFIYKYSYWHHWTPAMMNLHNLNMLLIFQKITKCFFFLLFSFMLYMHKQSWYMDLCNHSFFTDRFYVFICFKLMYTILPQLLKWKCSENDIFPLVSTASKQHLLLYCSWRHDRFSHEQFNILSDLRWPCPLWWREWPIWWIYLLWWWTLCSSHWLCVTVWHC